MGTLYWQIFMNTHYTISKTCYCRSIYELAFDYDFFDYEGDRPSTMIYTRVLGRLSHGVTSDRVEKRKV